MDTLDPEPKTPDVTKPVLTLNPPGDVTVLEKEPIKNITVKAEDNSGLPPTITMSGQPDGIVCEQTFESTAGTTTGYIQGTPVIPLWGEMEESRDFTISLSAKDKTTSGNELVVSFIMTVLRDTDGDGISDIKDLDDDGDGIPDLQENPGQSKIADATKPTIEQLKAKTILETETLAETVNAYDDSINTPTVSIKYQPDGVSYNPDTKQIVGTPEVTWGTTAYNLPEDSRVFPILITAVDTNNNIQTSIFMLTVLRDTDLDGIPDSSDPDDDNDGILDGADTNPKAFDDLTVSVTPTEQTVVESKPITTLNITENKPAEQTLTYSGGASGLELNGTANTISGSLTGLTWKDDAHEEQTITLTIDSVGANADDTAQNTVTLHVQRDTDGDGDPDITDLDDDGDNIPDVDDLDPKVPDETKPTIDAISNVVVTQGNAIPEITVKASDNSGIAPAIAVTNLPAGVSFDPDTLKITGTPEVTEWFGNEARSFTVTVTATDLSGNKASTIFIITVNRDTDNDGIPDKTDKDDDGDGIPDVLDQTPKDFTPLDVKVTPAEQTVTEGAPIDTLYINENKKATQTLTYTGGASGLSVSETANTIDGALTGLAWSNDETAANYESQVITVAISSRGVSDTDVFSNEATFTVQRDTDGDGEPDVTDTDDDGDGIPDEIDAEIKIPDKVPPTIDALDDVDVLEKDPIVPIPVVAEDDSGIPPTVTISGQPEGVVYNKDTKFIEGTPDVSDWGPTEEVRDFTIKVKAVDTNGNEYTEELVMTVYRDTDGDGDPDVTDPDDDGDTIPDETDPQPKVADTTAPDAPVINPVYEDAKTITGTGEPGATVVVTYPDGSTQETVVNTDGTWTVTPVIPLKPGDKITANQTDAAGNTSKDAQTTMQTYPIPQAPVVNPVREGDKTITGTGEPGAVITVTYPNGSTQTTTVKTDGTWSLTPTAALKAGDTIKVTQTNSRGDTSEPAIVKVLPALEAPALVLPMLHASFEGTNLVAGTGTPKSIITLTLPDGTIRTAETSEQGTWLIAGDNELAAGDIITAYAALEGKQTPEVMIVVLPGGM